jgi:3-hydroxybutyrate dehydrogenase
MIKKDILNNQNLVVLVTGGARGMGWGIIETFLDTDKSMVLCVDLNLPDENNIKKLGAKAENLFCYQANITVEEEVTYLYQQIKNKFKRVDILINNAGIIYKDLIEDMDLMKWNNILQVNLTGVMLMTKGVARLMKEQKWGRIINISSIQAFIGTKVYAAYSATKTGLLGLTKVCAAELAEFNVTVNAICPGFAHTDMVEKFIDNIANKNSISREEALAQIVAPVLQKRLIEPKEVGSLAVFLASENARGITGESIIISGGMVMH